MKDIVYAVRGVLVNKEKLLCIKNKTERIGYYDLPGGEIENGETPYIACVREFKEETGIYVKEASYKGTIIIKLEDRIINLKIFLVEKYSGNNIDEFDENYSMWLDIKEYLAKEKLYANSIILTDFFYNILKGDREFEIDLEVDEFDKIQTLNFKYV